MKLINKITVYTIAFITFTLTACTTQAEPAKPLTNFTASVTYENEKYTVVHSGNSLTSVTYHTPASLNGLNYTYKNDVFSVNYLSLSYIPSKGTLTANNNAIELHNILTSVSGNNCYLLSTTENTATYSLPTAEMVCDFTTGRIKEVKMKENSQNYTFIYTN